MKKWLARQLMRLSLLVDNNFHEITISDERGNTATFFGYGQWSATWAKPFELNCSC